MSSTTSGLQLSAVLRELVDGLSHDLHRDADMSLSHANILATLAERDEPMRMNAVAAAARVSRSRLSHAVQRLTRSGWVEQQGCPNDGRGQFLSLTENGRTRAERSAQLHQRSLDRRMLHRLDRRQLDGLLDIVETLRMPADTDPLVPVRTCGPHLDV